MRLCIYLLLFYSWYSLQCLLFSSLIITIMARKNIEKIAARNISYTEKQVAAKKEMDRANNKIAELVEQQVEIKKKLVEPYSLAEKLSKVK